METPDPSTEEIVLPVSAKAAQQERKMMARGKKFQRARYRKERASRDNERRGERAAIRDARWGYFLMNGSVPRELRLAILRIVSQRPSQRPTTPELLNSEFATERRALQRLIEGEMFPEEVPEGVSAKVRAVKATTLHEWKTLRADTAQVDKPPKLKPHALQNADRDALIDHRRQTRNYKKHRRMQRLQRRITGVRKLVKHVTQIIRSDQELRAIVPAEFLKAKTKKGERKDAGCSSEFSVECWPGLSGQ